MTIERPDREDRWNRQRFNSRYMVYFSAVSDYNGSRMDWPVVRA